MSEEKKIRVPFKKNDNVGLKDENGNVIVSTDLGYSKILWGAKNTALVCKDQKWALIDLDGNLLCAFIYDNIDRFCENRFKATTKIVDGYYTSKYYSILDEKGNVICGDYSELLTITDKTAKVCKNNKWAIIDLNGNLLCDFLYDRIEFLCEGYYKAGIVVNHQPKLGNLIVEYADTSIVYSILDEKCNTVCGGYNYLSEICDGEITAAINGRCGIIDLKGNIIIPLEHKYVQPLGEGHYLLSYDKPNDNFWSTVINRNGEIMIPARMKYREILQFKNGVARAYQNEKWGLIDDHGNHICNFEYTFIDDCGKGYYRVVKGAKKNVMRPNGTLVLNEWCNDVYNVENELFIFGNIIKKSKDNPKTRYIRGVANTNGDILFPMVFENVWWVENNEALYAQIGTKPYYLLRDGGIWDPEGGHLPSKMGIKESSYFENLANWVLPGLQFFYRDTDAEFNVQECYHIGDTIRAGFFIDATTKLQKPLHKTRFLIASAHAAFLFEDESYANQNPVVKEWNLVTFHFNSYFKVIDVYETPHCTQILLLHLPMSAASFLLDNQTSLNL